MFSPLIFYTCYYLSMLIHIDLVHYSCDNINNFSLHVATQAYLYTNMHAYINIYIYIYIWTYNVFPWIPIIIECCNSMPQYFLLVYTAKTFSRVYTMTKILNYPRYYQTALQSDLPNCTHSVGVYKLIISPRCSAVLENY
jgi:hypothetical protein